MYVLLHHHSRKAVTFLTSGNKCLCCSSVINPGQMQRSRPLIGLQQWLNRVAVILLLMTFYYSWAHFNFYGCNDGNGSCDEVGNMDLHAHMMWCFILKSLNCATESCKIVHHRHTSLICILTFLSCFIPLFLHSHISMMSPNANTNWLQQQCDDKTWVISTKRPKGQTGEQKRHQNTVICLWNNAVGVLQSGWWADVWTSLFSLRALVPSHTEWTWFIF